MSRDRDEEKRESERTDRKVSRRKFLKVSVIGAAVGGTGALSACMYTPAGSKTAGTTPKSVAQYQDSPNDGRRCGGCTHFLEPNGCEIVAGEISPDGWCRYHEPRPA